MDYPIQRVTSLVQDLTQELAVDLDGVVFSGNILQFQDTQAVIADGPDSDGRAYHAFPDLAKIGSTYWTTYMTSGQHADRRGDLVLKSSTDGVNWTLRKTFAASRPNGTIVNGDYEYRAGTVTDLGGGNLVCVMHKYNVVDAANLVDLSGNRTAWSVSNDNGDTWSAPTEMTPVNGPSGHIGGMPCAVWNGNFYLATYSTNAASGSVHFTSVANMIAGTPSWTVTVGDFGHEPCLMLNPDDPDEMWVSGRRDSVFLSYRSTTDGTTFSTRKDVYWEDTSVSAIGIKPQTVRTAGGIWAFQQRSVPDGLRAQVRYGNGPLTIYSGDGTPNDEVWTNDIMESFPSPVSPLNQRAWNGYEKLMYMGMIALSGDVIATAYALEPQEQFNSEGSITSYRSSVFFSFMGRGAESTPFGSFVPATRDLMDSTTLDMSASSESYRKWMDADTELTIETGPKTVALELLGDWTPSFVDGDSVPIVPTGSYDPDQKNVATISPGPNIIIANSAPPSPIEIAGLSDKILVQLSPDGIVTSGSDVTAWDNEGDTSFFSQYTASPTEPTISMASTPGGLNSVQGAATSYFAGPADRQIYAVYALAYYPDSTWNNGYEAIQTNAIQGQAAGTNIRQIGVPWNANMPMLNGVVATSGDHSGWNVLSCVQRALPVGGSSRLSPTDTPLGRFMGQVGQASRGWTGKVGAFVIVGGDQQVNNREDILIRRWMRSL